MAVHFRQVVLHGCVTLCIVLAGCHANGGTTSVAAAPSAKARPAHASAGQPALALVGSRIIACCCNTPCPCRMNYKPTHCHGCDATTAVHVESGEINGVAMDGVNWVIMGRFFGEDPANNWNYVYVSDKATPAQVSALKGMLEKNMRDLGDKARYLAGQGLGLRQVPIQWSVSADRRDWSVKVPGVLELKTRSIVLPGHPRPVTSQGIFDDYGDSFVHADCIVHRYDDPSVGYSWQLDGRQSNQADFRLTSDQIARGGIGWGCWSAHADLGDAKRTQYQEKSIGHH